MPTVDRRDDIVGEVAIERKVWGRRLSGLLLLNGVVLHVRPSSSSYHRHRLVSAMHDFVLCVDRRVILGRRQRGDIALSKRERDERLLAGESFPPAFSSSLARSDYGSCLLPCEQLLGETLDREMGAQRAGKNTDLILHLPNRALDSAIGLVLIGR